MLNAPIGFVLGWESWEVTHDEPKQLATTTFLELTFVLRAVKVVF
jgi:hypothetical protein